MNEDREAATVGPVPSRGPAAGVASPESERPPVGPAGERTTDGSTGTAGPCLIAVVGDSGSGKSTVAEAVATLLGNERVTDLRLDDYHRFTREERIERGLTALNPAVHNLSLMREHLRLLRSGRTIRNRSYNHSDGSFGPIRPIVPGDIVVVVGLLGFPTDDLESLYHLTVFLQPEPELLFRWKLRRDVRSRGYTEAAVLKNIVQHLLDSKEFVVPQAQRADVLVRYELPTSDSGDDQILTSVILRGIAADIARGETLVDGLGPSARQHDDGSEVRIELGNELSPEEVHQWAAGLFPGTYAPGAIGCFTDEAGHPQVRPPLAVIEVLIARLTTLLRAAENG